MPYLNHWWQVTFYVNSRGLTTALMPYGRRMFEIQFDFVDHHLVITATDGASESLALSSCSVADFYNEFMARLSLLGMDIRIWPVPVEVENPVPFLENKKSLTYDPNHANNFWRILVQVDRVFQQFRSGFIGKCSPSHFFWGSFDFAMTRFSGQRAPEHAPVPNVKHAVVKEAYSHEVCSCGFWPGGGAVREPVFYSYAYPEPLEYKHYRVQPAQASYSSALGEYILPYGAVCQAADPDRTLLSFLKSSYEAAAVTGHWNRSNLERQTD